MQQFQAKQKDNLAFYHGMEFLFIQTSVHVVHPKSANITVPRLSR